mmetsp:Transcript_129/g.167  ORF Transcript_129/g.167 Transcript_129/m.167 type:complete len:565 (-) Transcript_129:291-1985(-)|eukprot:CAMPEP_0184021286 /NCGR_PEP_ID=MMETSP0954-20121128/9838_1 /TAXON_ID=627963 /ORGANISM="Aplanochytrium sp, Strain PBS07" /LENGTH=564 /DNA_ID=CAMNT_0026303277 /DNA_START=229 /DNA_END=1923 /DNA_ORIENTATION=+
MGEEKTVHLLDYGAGNVLSVKQALKYLHWKVVEITEPSQLDDTVKKLVFPGVGNFASAMQFLNEKGFTEPLRDYIKADRPFLGICLGLQTLFEESEESPGTPGLGIIPGKVERFPSETADGPLSVPHIGWNGLTVEKPSRLFKHEWDPVNRVYFVHSYCARPTAENKEWILTSTVYGSKYISAVQKGNVMATQFHPEKSGENGLRILNGFLSETTDPDVVRVKSRNAEQVEVAQLSKRIIACLDVTADADGELIVTKGDSYDIMEESKEGGEVVKKRIRNIGNPLNMAEGYYLQGVDEVTFLSISSWNNSVLGDQPLHRLLQTTSSKLFVPLTIGGGIRDYTRKDGELVTALEVAASFFRSGADKVSIGSDAVRAVQKLQENGYKPDGSTSIEKISKAYGKQAVVVSVDPRRVYLDTEAAIQEAEEKQYTILEVDDIREGKSTGQKAKCWYASTVSGGKTTTSLDAIELVKGVEILGAGEILLNCIDFDGKKQGFDIKLIQAVCNVTTLPVIASSGAGKKEDFEDLFKETRAEAGLAAGIFHKQITTINEVKEHIYESGIATRL